MTQPPDVVQQVLNYCRHQAGKGTESLAALMERTRADWARCLEGMTDHQAAFASGSEWSSSQVLTHFLNVTEGVNRQIEQLTAGSLQELPAEDASKPAETPPVADLRTAVDQIFGDTAGLTRSLEGNPNLDREFPHPMFGKLNILEWIAFQRVHAQDHIGQVEKNKADPAYPAA
jgi:hypothetical protein